MSCQCSDSFEKTDWLMTMQCLSRDFSLLEERFNFEVMKQLPSVFSVTSDIKKKTLNEQVETTSLRIHEHAPNLAFQ